MTENIERLINEISKQARAASREMLNLTTAEKNTALQAIAKQIRADKEIILTANKEDLQLAHAQALSPALIDRLMLTAASIEQIAASITQIIELPDPVGRLLMQTERPNGLKIKRISIPIGVIGVIYESRPNVTVDAAVLCLKSGNAVVLRGGKESYHTSFALFKSIQAGLVSSKLPVNAVQMVPTVDRQAVTALLKQHENIDVIVPRGGKQLIEFILQHSTIPLFKHLAGICHTYIHRAADLEMACKVVLNAKMRRTGICGATEILLIDREILATHLPSIINTLLEAGCEIRGDAEVKQYNKQVILARDLDFSTEFLAPIIAIKTVENLTEAIAEINLHGTQHTEAIITDDRVAAEKFFIAIDSAIVMHNTSTQFADGGEFGMGAEIGIATGKLHARGPVGLEQLTTFKYLVEGTGQTRGT